MEAQRRARTIVPRRAGGGAARRAAPWAASILLHAGLFTALAGVAIEWRREPPQAGVAVSFGEQGGHRFEPRARPTPEAPPRSPAPRDSLDLATDPESSAMPALAMATNAAEPTLPLSGAPTLDLAEPAPVQVAIALDAEPGPPPELFGARGDAPASRVVYVLDASGSMVAQLPQIRRELARSIAALTAKQWFQVVIYRGSGYEMAPDLGERMLPSTEANRRAIVRWLEGVQAARRSEPLPALERALALRPDIVFLLSKGVGDAGRTPGELEQQRAAMLARLDALNPRSTAGIRPVTIKVIHFFDPDPTGALRAIADAHGGQNGLTFISRKAMSLE